MYIVVVDTFLFLHHWNSLAESNSERLTCLSCANFQFSSVYVVGSVAGHVWI